MLIKMYYHFMVCACTCLCTTVFTVSQIHADFYLVYFVFQIAYMFLFDTAVLSESINSYESITTITIHFGESQSKLSSSELLLLQSSIVHVF